MCAICGDNQHHGGDAGLSRRGFLKLAGIGVAGLALSNVSLLASGEKPKPENVIPPREALARLRAGNARYVSGASRHHDFSVGRKALAAGQNPFAAILSCADSRVAPEFAFDTGRGDLFVVRVAGNFVNDDSLASFEYAAEFLGTPLIVVLGHDKCGAVHAAIETVQEHAELPGHLPGLVKHIRPAVQTALHEPGDLLANAIRENVALNVAHLKSASPIISKYVQEGKVQIAGGIYKLETGRVEWID